VYLSFIIFLINLTFLLDSYS